MGYSRGESKGGNLRRPVQIASVGAKGGIDRKHAPRGVRLATGTVQIGGVPLRTRAHHPVLRGEGAAIAGLLGNAASGVVSHHTETAGILLTGGRSNTKHKQQDQTQMTLRHSTLPSGKSAAVVGRWPSAGMRRSLVEKTQWKSAEQYV